MCPIQASTKAIGAAMAMHIIPSHANTSNPIPKTNSARNPVFRSSFSVAVFLYPWVIVATAPITIGSNTNRPAAYSCNTATERKVKAQPLRQVIIMAIMRLVFAFIVV
jgi:hypothetical protein